MITFIVPTLWKSEHIHSSVKSFLEHNSYGAEFIIIDNASSDYMHPGITVVKPDVNKYVNPAWNLGVRMAKHNTVCLLNDDITFNFKTLFNNLPNLLNEKYGIIAFDPFNFDDELNKDDDVLSLVQTNNRGIGFGCMMIIPKENYIEIPETMTVFSGDDYIYYYQENYIKHKCYNINNFKVIGELSATSGTLDDLMQHEAIVFQGEISKLQKRFR